MTTTDANAVSKEGEGHAKESEPPVLPDVPKADPGDDGPSPKKQKSDQ